jgi:tetratricopeptide (TPR) repeat protein
VKLPERFRKTRTIFVACALCAALALSPVAVSSCSSKKKVAAAETDDTLAVAIMAQDGFELRRGTEYWLGAQETTSLYAGDTISTPYGDVLAGLTDGATLRVSKGAWLSLGAGDDISLRITRGEVLLEAPRAAGRLKVTTEAGELILAWGTAAVFVEPGGSTTFTIFEGKSSVTAGGATEKLDGGSTCKIEPGARPDPEKISSGNRPAIGDYATIVAEQTFPFFEYEQTREETEGDAQAKLAVNPVDTWQHINLGRALLDKGDIQGADAEFNSALTLEPQQPQALCGLGKVRLAQHRWEDADGLYDRARHADASSAEALYGWAQAALGAGDLVEAERRYKSALRVDSQDNFSSVGLGDVLLLMGDVDGAMTRFNDALKTDDHMALAMRQLGIARALKREQVASQGEFNKAVTQKSGYYEVWDSLGIAYLKSGDQVRAGASFRKLEDSDATRWRAEGLRQTSYIQMLKSDLRAAASGWQKSLDLLPGKPGVLTNEGLARLSLGEAQAALAPLTAAVAMEPDSANAHANLARACWALGNRDAAAVEAKKASSLDPSDWRSRMISALTGEGGDASLSAALKIAPQKGLTAADRGLLGEAYTARKDYGAAYKQYSEAAKLQPASTEWPRKQAGALASRNKPSEAIAMYRKALQKDARDLESRLALAVLLEKKGDRSGAEEQLKRALEQDPTAWRARVKLGELLLAGGDVDGAIDEFESAKSTGLQPADLANILVLEGNAFDKRQMFPQAIGAYQQALGLDASRGDAWFYVAGDFERTGQQAAAKDAYQKAMQLCLNRPEWKDFYTQAAQKLSQMK